MAIHLRAPLLLAGLAAAASVAGCGRSGPAPLAAGGSSGGSGQARFEVVAAESFWGSIASQLAGAKATVRSIVIDPNGDPHSYQPSAQDARTMANASVAIVNGVGYDSWAQQLLQASPAAGREVLNVGDLLGLGAGANPHRWYFPADVRTVARRIVADYERLDPSDTAYFAQRERAFEVHGLARYDRLRAEIRRRYAGVPVGYSESIFQGLGEDLGLRLRTPYSFAKAISEGTDVTAHDKEAVDAQAQSRQIKVWIYNSQNVTPDVQRIEEIARQRHIPIATVTETLTPASASFEQWQDAELEGLLRALHAATGR